MDFGFVVVGAGFFGATVAERIATKLSRPVLVVEKRDHIGGASFSEPDRETGVEVHKYGSHIFHTSDPEVRQYLASFSPLNSYSHRVLAISGLRIYSMPINLSTICAVYGRVMGPEEAKAQLLQDAGSVGTHAPANLEEKAVAAVGWPLYKALIRGYTRKQWGLDPKLLPAEIITRLPVRFSHDDRYFSDTWQGIPVTGYGEVFRRMLANPLIDLRLSTDFFEMRKEIPAGATIIYTGPVDRYFGYRHGALAWRSSRFEVERHKVPDYQGTAVMNYADEDVPWTRVHEFRHFHPERQHGDSTIIFREYPAAASGGENPFYPVNTPEDRRRMALYQEDCEREKRVLFGGRLGTYSYLDMHVAIRKALDLFADRIAGVIKEGR